MTRTIRTHNTPSLLHLVAKQCSVCTLPLLCHAVVPLFYANATQRNTVASVSLSRTEWHRTTMPDGDSFSRVIRAKMLGYGQAAGETMVVPGIVFIRLRAFGDRFVSG